MEIQWSNNCYKILKKKENQSIQKDFKSAFLELIVQLKSCIYRKVEIEFTSI